MRPANPGGVIFALAMAVLLLVLMLVLGPSETHRGIPMWVFAAIGVPCFLLLAARSWRRPRR